MGRLLETLRRHDSARALPVETPQPLADSSEQQPSTSANGPPPLDPAETLEMPFIEVPEVHSARPIPAASVPPAVHPNGSAGQPAVRFVEAAAAGRPPASEVSPELIVWSQPVSPAAAQYREVAAALKPLLSAANPHGLLFLPLTSSAKHTPAAINLALALADGGQRVLFVDADTRSRRAALLLGLATAPGWTDVLHGLPTTQAIQDTGWNHLHVLAAGNRLADSVSPLYAERMRLIFSDLCSRYDLVLMQAPPWSTGGIAAVLPHLCNAACLLLDKQQADQPAELSCLEALHSQHVRVVGSVVIAS